MTGVDAVIAKGFIDPKKLCVTGGSDGGLLTAWTVTQTGRFPAAVSQYPVTNWITQTGSSDIGLVMMRWMKAAPWENPQQYIAHSPVFFAHKVTTPTMVLTGEEDWRTPMGQSEEFPPENSRRRKCWRAGARMPATLRLGGRPRVPTFPGALVNA
jgi:dipeptidyl aminopeptidase/acylaminoacyl peptidase